MSKFSKRQLSAIVLAISLTSLFTISVYAYPAAKWLPNFAGITTAIAEKDVSYSPNNKFSCVSRSYTNYPSANITHLGYNTFSCNVWKNGSWNNGWTRSGSSNWNSSYHVDSGSVYVSSSGSSYRKVTSAGSHDFGHFNGQSYDWDPSLSASGTYYP